MVVPIRLATITWRNDERGRAPAAPGAAPAVVIQLPPRPSAIEASSRHGVNRCRDCPSRYREAGEGPMINVTVTYTDNLGPEADIPGLLRKIARRLEADFGRESMVGMCIGALRLTDFIV